MTQGNLPQSDRGHSGAITGQRFTKCICDTGVYVM